MKKKLMAIVLCLCMTVVMVTPYASVFTASGSLPVSFAHADEPAEGTSAPADEQTTAPADEQTTAPADEQTTAPADEQTTAPADEQTTAPADKQTTAPADEQTTAPADEQTTAPADEQTTAPADEQTTAPADEQTTAPADEQTTAPAVEETPAPAIEETPVPSTGKALFVQEGKALPMQIEKVVSSYLEDGYSSVESVAIGTASAQVPENGKLTLTGGNGVWQVEVEDGVWATIADEDGSKLSVTAAFLKNLGGSARIRSAGLETLVSVTTAVEVPTQYETQTVGGEESIETSSESAANSLLDFLAGVVGSMRGGASTYGATGSAATYTVVINYLFEDGSAAASAYTATLAAGSSFSQAVASPAVLGYEPDQATVNISVTDIQADKTYTVTYRPALVSYTVMHYQQNVSNDSYTLVETEDKTGYTENEVGESLGKTYAGFTPLLYDGTTKIAADGSTVVEIYYDRNYYLLSLDLNGGYGAEPVYARYGAPISVATPERAGYTFAGWQDENGNTVEIPATMPVGGGKYAAQWTPNETAKVTVVFWGQNANDNEYSYLPDYTKEIYLAPGTEFTYTESGFLTCTLQEHTHDTCNLICNQSGHIHSKDCYQDVGREAYLQGVLPQNPQDGQIYYSEYVNNKYIYIKGKWYRYNGNAASGSIVTPSCGLQESVHVHTDACYDCGKTAHSHTADCYLGGVGLDGNLWKFEKSDTITVEGDGSSVVNVYYTRTEKTLTFKYNYESSWWSGEYKSTETITARWGQDISTKYTKIAENAGSTFWSADYSGTGPYTNYFGVMPTTSATYYNRTEPGSEGSMTYWGQDLKGEYTVKLYEVPNVGNYYVSDEDRYEFEGFLYDHGASNGENCNGAEFYYNRRTYTLTFNDGYDDVKKEETVKYEAPLSTYSDFVPSVPSAYEAGSVIFDGWYQNPACTGEEYKLDEHKMPAGDVLLYAKWKPVDHTVTTWLTSDMTTPVNVGTTGTNVQTVAHRSTATEPDTPTNGQYTFVGWFYMENGVEKAFDFSMPVTKNLDLYAKWSANVMVSYTIHYQLSDGTPIADDTTGSALAGSTRTFEAKTGTELLTDYQSGYFPTSASHSITMDINGDNEYTFVYEAKDKVAYTVRYLDRSTGEPVVVDGTPVEDKTETTSDAVITETFKVIAGYAPDAYQKRLVLSATESENVIIFWYSVDTQHAPVQVVHWIQNAVGDNYTEYQSTTDLNGVIGQNYEADALTITGFTYVKGTAVVSGETEQTVTAPTKPSYTLDNNGLVLNLYYDRIEYPYEFRFLEYATQADGSHAVLAESVTGTARYGAQVTQAAKTIPGYDLVTGSPDNQAITIAVENPADTASVNVKTFYYTEQTVDIRYVVVGDPNCGTLSSYQDLNVPVLTGNPTGSTPTAAENYRFVGWYTGTYDSETGTVTLGAQVPSSWVDSNNKLTPQKQDVVIDLEGHTLPMFVAATYYAKFELDVTTVTVKKLVSGNFADTTKLFAFQYKLGDNGTWTDAQSLAHNGSFTIENVTIGSTLYIREKPEDYTPSVASTVTAADHLTGAASPDGQGTNWYQATVTGVQMDETITFTNNRTTTPDTGVLLDSLPYVLILAVVAVGVVLMIVRRRRDDD